MQQPQQQHPKLASTAFLMADPARAAMLLTLLDGRALPAGELAYAAGITAQTASAHLGKLLAGSLVTVEVQGRHRYYRLANAQVAAALESLAAIDPAPVIRQRPHNRQAQELRWARCCYDHLAGQLGVAVTRSLQERNFIVAAEDKQFDITVTGNAWLVSMGLDPTQLKTSRRGVARQCLDWTEREHHLGGPLAVQLMRLWCDKGWLRRIKDSRAVQITPVGKIGLQQEFGINAGINANIDTGVDAQVPASDA